MNQMLISSELPTASGSHGMRRSNALPVAVLLALSLAGQSAATDIVLRNQATPRSRIVRLGDVATVQDSDDAVAQRLANLPLMPAPAEGSTHVLSAGDVRNFISVLGEEVTQLRIRGAERVTITSTRAASAAQAMPAVNSATRPQPLAVTGSGDANDAVTQALTARRSQTITRDRQHDLQQQLEALVVSHLRRQSGEDGPWEVEIESADRCVDRLALATSQPQIVGGEAPWTGRQRFLVDCLSDSGEIRIPVYANVARQEAILVAKSPIDANRLITRAAVDMKYVSTKNRRSARREVASNLDDVLGKMSTRNLRPGDVFYLDQVREPLLVERGDTVQAIARGGGIEVRTYVQARNDGMSGELIEVQSLESKERFFAKVVGQGQVEVFAGGATGSARTARPQRLVRRPPSTPTRW